MKQRYITFGMDYYIITTNCLGGFAWCKKRHRADGFGFVEFSDRRIETLKRLGFKEW